MAGSIFLAIEGRLLEDLTNPNSKFVIRDLDKEAAREAYHKAMEQEYYFYLRANDSRDGVVCEIDENVKQQVLGNRDEFIAYFIPG